MCFGEDSVLSGRGQKDLGASSDLATCRLCNL